MSIELTERTTHDEIQAYVDQVVADVAADREGEKSDAQSIAEERDTVTGSDGNSAADEPQSGQTESESTWLDDDLKAEVAAYGLSDADIAEFTSRDELERALRIFDKTAQEAGRKAMVEGESEETQEGKVRDERGRFAAKESESTATKDGRFEISDDFKDVYEDGIVTELERMRDHYEDRLAKLESRFAMDEIRAAEQQFDNLVDGLGYQKLFGKTGSETPEQLKRRQDLIVACKAQQIGMSQLGRSVEMDESLVSRVARMVFAGELSREERKQLTRKISKQSNNRLGGSAVKAHDAPESLRDEMRRRYKELEGN